MALVVKDRVKETSTITGTGTLTLAGASDNFQSFSVIGDGNTTYYAIVDTATGDWEVGLGTYTASGTTLSRDTVLESSNSGSLVSFAGNTVEVFCTYPAEKSAFVDDIPTNNNELTNGAGYITDYTVTEGDVTAHQAALSITESQISDLGSYITGNQTITLSGDVSGSGTTSIAVTIADDSHNHVISNVDGLQTALDGKQDELTEGAFVDGDKTKLDGIESGADVTDTANVTAAGALMDSEVTNLAQVKAFDSSDYATAAQGALADSAVQPSDNISGLTNDSGYITGNQTITLSGDVSGSGTTSISVTVADDSHNHTIANVDGLQDALDNVSADLVNDTTPQLGGNLDLNSNNITGTGNIDVTGKITTDRIVLPNYTTTERNALTGVVSGDTIYNSTTNSIEFYDGTNWISTNLIPTINSISGTIYAGAASSLTLSLTNATDTIDVKYYEGGTLLATDSGVTVTSGSATSTVPAAVYGQTAGDTISIQIFNQDGTPSSNAISKTVVGFPTGGTITTTGSYRVHTFNSSSSLVVPSGLSLTNVEYLVIAGGGGGGGNEASSSGNNGGAGGGGAGGYRSSVSGESSGGGSSAESSLSLSAGSYTVTVGAGGAGGAEGSANNGVSGSNSVFSTITSLGGGYGGGAGDSVTRNGSSGGSGGGSGAGSTNGTGGSGTSGQGYAGGNNGSNTVGGGGGGASAVGAEGTSTTGSGGGGDGVASSINGTSTYRAGGGAGGVGAVATQTSASQGGLGGGGDGGWGSSSGDAGTTNTGSGGGGGADNGGNGAGGNGGSGIVIVRYQL